MATREQIRDTAFAALNSGVEVEAAARLKEYFKPMATVIGGNITLPENDAGYIAMAREAIHKNRITFDTRHSGKKTLTLDQIDGILDQRVGQEKKEQMLGAKRLNDLIPSQEGLGKIANAVSDSAEEQVGSVGGTTWGNAWKGFSKMMQEQGFIAAIIAAISMLLGIESDGAKDLKSYAATAAAENVQDSTVGRLVKLRESDPALKNMLSDDNIKKIGSKAYASVMKEAGFESPLAESAETQLANVKMRELGDQERTMLGVAFHTEALKKGKKDIFQGIKEGLAEGELQANGISSWIPNAQGLRDIVTGGYMAVHNSLVPEARDVNRAADIIATATSSMFSDTNFRHNGKPVSELTQDEFQAAARERIAGALSEHKSEIPSFEPKTTGKMLGISAIDKIADIASQKLRSQYDMLPFEPSPPKTLSAQISEATSGMTSKVVGGNQVHEPTTQLANLSPPSAIALGPT